MHALGVRLQIYELASDLSLHPFYALNRHGMVPWLKPGRSVEHNTRGLSESDKVVL